MFRFLHTSDLHIGRPFAGFPSALSSQLRAARSSSVERIAQEARRRSIGHVLIAGDMFDAGFVPREDISQTAEMVSEYPDVQWWILPGNHDPAAAPVWDAWRSVAPANAKVLSEAGVVEIETGVYVHAAPILGAAGAGDPTSVWGDLSVRLPGVRIGLAHGSVASFGSDADPNVIDVARLSSGFFDCVCLGDWHNQKEIRSNVFYSGTPEPDGFGVEGRVWDVRIGSDGLQKDSVPTAFLRWVRSSDAVPLLDTDEAVAALLRKARPEGKARQTLWEWECAGQITPSARATLRASFEEMSSSFFFARVKEEKLRPVYSAQDAAMMAPAGALRQAADGLMEKAATGDDPRAERALSLLADALKGTA